MLTILGLIGIAYSLGSVPFGFIVGSARGLDLRKIGSGNIGTTNVYRAFGLPTALLVFVLDASKGLAATRILPTLWTAGLEPEYLALICGIAVIAGSVASVFMRFRGGKGVAAAVGVFLGLEPVATAICIGLWAGLVAKFGYVSLGSVTGAIALPILIVALNHDAFATSPVFYLAALVAMIVVVRHKSNIRRLREGTEHRISRLEEKT
jgi:glycerol-3-phosphate acyltransferase PlsY